MTEIEQRKTSEPLVNNNSLSLLEELRGSVLFYIDPFKPVGLEDWNALKTRKRKKRKKGG
ncbi:hypothetical protein [Caballeronia sp. LZ035]|uniref:hypothetical protein n=1 Tax=Caballeronia sp. LZ035 TaxID=3038568 RepID=UPI0028651D8D|nr:hypothetical protein [Caballeronia sp. LZ035]MDR5761674.1 hypothetical protein [Caballeronia sp. LZ035]